MATLASHNSANACKSQMRLGDDGLLMSSLAAVKRILREAREIQADPSVDFAAGPLEVCISMSRRRLSLRLLG